MANNNNNEDQPNVANQLTSTDGREITDIPVGGYNNSEDANVGADNNAGIDDSFDRSLKPGTMNQGDFNTPGGAITGDATGMGGGDGNND